LANDRITVTHDNGILFLLLGGLLVWLWFKYRGTPAATSTEEARESAAHAGQPSTCGATDTANQIVPSTTDAHTQDLETGRFINGISPSYN
jgi:hypothetical protein